MPRVDRARYQRLRQLVLDAAERTEDERRAWLEIRCADDPALVEEVLALLTDDLATGVLSPTPTGLEDAFVEIDAQAGTTIGPYEVEQEIGRGGMGVVFAARAADGSRVAVKVLHPHLAATPGMAERFQREAELGRRIDHDNVVRTLDVGETDLGRATLPYLVMEYVEGRTLRALQEDLGTVPEALLREIALQVTRGLQAIHAGGVIHRDLKPENLLVTPTHQVRITDLGVARLADVTTPLTLEGQFVGSLRYASPEQCEGSPIGAASDLYALGIVLYELLTGRHPFEADDPRALLAAHLKQRPVPLTERNPDLSAFLGQVIDILLAKEPTRRFASSAELARVLSEGEDGPWWAERREALSSRSRLRLPVGRETGMHGRAPELARLDTLWSGAKQGHGAVVRVEAEAGFGKSRLVDAWIATLDEGEADVLYASYAPSRGRGGLRDAVVERFGLDNLEAHLEPLLGDLSSLGSAFAAMVRHESTPDGAAQHSRGSLAAVLVRVLKGLAADRPLVWVIEDLHFADANAHALALSLARAVADVSALLVVTARPGLDEQEVEQYARLPRYEKIGLATIDQTAIEGLLLDALGSEALARKLAPTVTTRSGGVPLFALQVLQDLKERGHLERSTAGPWIEVKRVTGVETPPALRQAIHDRLEALSRDERAVLDVAALLGTVFDPALIARVRDLKRIEVLETLGHLERKHGLVRSDAARFRFDHHLVQEVAAEDLPPQLKAEYHALLADALADRGQVPQDDGYGATGDLAWQIVRHAVKGSAPERWLPLLGRALEHLSTVMAHETACELTERVLAMPQLAAGTNRVVVLTERARHLNAIGRRDQAELVLAEAGRIAEEVGDEKGELKVRVIQSFQWLSLAQYDQAFEEAEKVAALAERLGDEDAEGQSYTVKGQVRWCQGRYEEGRAFHERGLALARRRGDLKGEARVLSDISVIDQELGFNERAEENLRRALEILDDPSEKQAQRVMLTNLGNVLHALGRNGEAVETYRLALDLCEQFIDRIGESVAWVNIGEVLSVLGDIPRARRAYEQSLAICREIEAPRIAGYAVHGLARLALWTGRTEEALAEFEKALDIRKAVGHRPGEADSQRMLGRMALEAGRVDEARERLDEALALSTELGEVNGALIADAWRMLLPDGDARPVRAALTASDQRLGLDVKLEACYLLWRKTGEPDDLAAARHHLATLRAHAPTDMPSDDPPPIHRALDEAS